MLSARDRTKALNLLLSPEDRHMVLDESENWKICFWPRWPHPGSARRYVEPDVVLSAGEKIVIVEVKWGAPLHENQLADQLGSFKKHCQNKVLKAVVLLGFEPEGSPRASNHHKQFEDVRKYLKANLPDARLVERPWRDVNREVSSFREGANLSSLKALDPWVYALAGFLQRSGFYREFMGFQGLGLQCPQSIGTWSFKSGRTPPWFKGHMEPPGTTKWTFEKGIK